MSKRLPQVGGYYVQCEDELAGMHACAGASLGGLKAMTATSGPGYTLMHDAYGCHVDIANCSPRGWLDHDVILHEIAKYAGFVAKEFGGEVVFDGERVVDIRQQVQNRARQLIEERLRSRGS